MKPDEDGETVAAIRRKVIEKRPFIEIDGMG
jgi:hypothetical protein